MNILSVMPFTVLYQRYLEPLSVKEPRYFHVSRLQMGIHLNTEQTF